MFKKQLFSLLSSLLVITLMVGCSKKQEQEQPKQVPLVNATKAIV